MGLIAAIISQWLLVEHIGGKTITVLSLTLLKLLWRANARDIDGVLQVKRNSVNLFFSQLVLLQTQ